MWRLRSLFQLHTLEALIGSFSDAHTMSPTTRTWLVCAVLLCGAAGSALPHIGRCSGKQCVAFFQKRTDFRGAQEGCRSRDGELWDTAEVPDFVSSVGSFWLGGAAEPQPCRSVNVASGGNVTLAPQSCHGQLDGFLCRFKLSNPCSALAPAGGASVNFTSQYFEVLDSTSFPQGTVAVTQRSGAHYADSKHLCFSGEWLRAPWKCEVMEGGCDNVCLSEYGPCGCPPGQSLHPNKLSCVKDPCAGCAVDAGRPKCGAGYKLADDGKSCVDVDECAEQSHCLDEGTECVNTKGGFECRCREGFWKDQDDGQCVDGSICDKCEHECVRAGKVSRCVCYQGFRVSKLDPTKCLMHCSQQDCLADCVPDAEREKNGNEQCFCPDGYIKDRRGNQTWCTDIDECQNHNPCDQDCKNLFGTYQCFCRQGFQLVDGYRCVDLKKPKPEGSKDKGQGSGSKKEGSKDKGEGSRPKKEGSADQKEGSKDKREGSGPEAVPSPASVHPAAVPPYIRTGSILGITVFLLLVLALLYFVLRDVTKRCSEATLYTLKPMDVFSLQQVTSETYKRFSFDRQSCIGEGQT